MREFFFAYPMSINDDLYEPIGEAATDEDDPPPVGHNFDAFGYCTKCKMTIFNYVLNREPCRKK
jgi:hypothetical protein